MSDTPISLEQGIQILSHAFSHLRGNPPGWQDKGNLPAAGGTVTMPGNTRPKGDPGAETPTNPGMGGPSVPGDPPGWSPRTYAYGDMASLPKYGPHNPVLSDEQAATLHLVWSILGIDGSTVGKGGVKHWDPTNLADRNYHQTPYDDSGGGGAISQAQVNAQDDPAREFGYVDTSDPNSAATSVARSDKFYQANDAQYQARVAATAAQPTDGSHNKNMR